jgi:hypothetical protein
VTHRIDVPGRKSQKIIITRHQRQTNRPAENPDESSEVNHSAQKAYFLQAVVIRRPDPDDFPVWVKRESGLK